MSHNIHPESSLNRVPKAIVTKKVVVDGKQSDVKSFTPLHQVQVHRGRTAYQTTSFKGVPSNLFQGSSRFVGQIQQGSLPFIKSATLKITVQVTAGGGSGTLVAVSDWFERIEVKAQNGSKLLTTLYSDTNLFNYNLIESQKLRKLKEVGLIDNDWNTEKKVSSSQDVTVYLPLIGSIFGLSDMYFENSVGDLNLEFYPNSSGILRIQTGSSVSCSGMELICETEVLTAKDGELHLAHFSKSISSCRFLEPIENHFYSYQMNNGQEYKFDMDAITGDVSHFLVLIRPSGTNTQSIISNHTYSNIGFNGSVDIQNSSGKSMFGNGSPVPYGFLNSEVFNSHITTDWNVFKNSILIPFCHNVTNSHHGVKDSFLPLRGQRHYVAITPNNSTWVNGTYDVRIYAFIHRTLAHHNGRFTASDDHS